MDLQNDFETQLWIGTYIASMNNSKGVDLSAVEADMAVHLLRERVQTTCGKKGGMGAPCVLSPNHEHGCRY